MKTLTERYNLCRKEIAERFFEGRDPGEIIESLETGDRHLQGEAVSKLNTSLGEVLYYKPRDCRTSELLGEINDLLFGSRLVPVQVTREGFAFQKRKRDGFRSHQRKKPLFIHGWAG